MRNFYFIFFLFVCFFSFSQGITVDITSFTNEQLVKTKLLKNDCITATSFTSSSPESVGYFNKAGSNFPLSEGIIIRSGKALSTAGQYTGNNVSSQINTNSDPFLQQLSTSTGQTEPITDVGFLEFEFVPVSNKFSFDFIFASNEYGEFQCGFSDVFAFVLTNLNTGTVTNLAIIPGTNLPVSVRTIRDALFNFPGTTCGSNNPILFDKFNVGNASSSDLNMRGITKILNASSDVIPNNNYKIRLVVGDYKDSNFDSAVFIKGGSFVTTLDLGPDKSICLGDKITLDTKLNLPFTHKWFKNGIELLGETNSTYDVVTPGTYKVESRSGNCFITDTVIFTDLQVTAPVKVFSCDNGPALNSYNLTSNNPTSLLGATNGALYSLEYFTSTANITANNPIPMAQLNSFSSLSGQIIYIKIKKNANGKFCDAVYNFELVEKPQIVLGNPPTISQCANNSTFILNNTTTINSILNGLTGSGYTISFFNTPGEANANSGMIPTTLVTSYSLPTGTTTGTVYVRVEDINISSCFATTSINLILNPLPLADAPNEVIECSSYVLPTLTNGSYHSAPGGDATTLITLPFTVVDSSTIYVYNGPNANGCSKENSFKVILMDEYDLNPTYGCDKFIIPLPPAGNFFSGPGGTGTQYLPGTEITVNNTIIYFYVVLNGVVCRDTQYTIPIYPTPILASISNVTACDSYVLPSVPFGDYFTSSGGIASTKLPVGTIISETQALLPNGSIVPVIMPLKVYNYYDNGQCSKEISFVIKIINTTKFVPKTECGQFQLPALAFGGYFSGPNGTGTSFAPLTAITSNQTIYFYEPNSPICAQDLKYVITITPKPIIDLRTDISICGTYYLPPLTNGNYYFQADGQGGIIPANTPINATTDVWVYRSDNLIPPCKNDVKFKVTIKTKVSLDDSPGDQYVPCTLSKYQLKPLTVGKYYTQTNGQGTQLFANDFISINNTTVYIYNDLLPDPLTFCPNEVSFKVFINYVEIKNVKDVNECDSYTLTALNEGNYFTQPNGLGTTLPVGTKIFINRIELPLPSNVVIPIASMPLTLYAYVSKGNAPRSCTNEVPFTVNITNTPLAEQKPDIERCGSYDLPTLFPNNFYFSESGGLGTAYIAGQKISIGTSEVPTTQKIYVRAIAPTNAKCAQEKFFTLKLNPLLKLNVPNGILCVDFPSKTPFSTYTMNTFLDTNLFTVNWFLNGIQVGTGASYTAVVDGTYTIKTIKLLPETGLNCNYRETTVLVEPSSAAVAQIQLSDYFENETSVSVVNLQGFGNYVFQIDGGNYQPDSTFNGISSGSHTMFIKDIKNDCGITEIPFNLINYPKFFTPNGDGFNETWNIFDLKNTNSKISIFDRFGKLIKQISTDSKGWDGTLNDIALPSTDYWFVLNYQINNQPKELRGHFTLKR